MSRISFISIGFILLIEIAVCGQMHNQRIKYNRIIGKLLFVYLYFASFHLSIKLMIFREQIIVFTKVHK